MQIQTPFDIMAPTYESDFVHSQIGQLQRERVWNVLNPILNEQERSLQILELNCGTGADAIRLASLGHHILATDASESMLSVARQKMIGKNLDRLSFELLRIEELSSIMTGSFDMVFSNFGGINCVNEAGIRKLARDLDSKMKPGAYLVLVVFGRYCIWEIMYYLMKGRPRQAFRRMRKENSFGTNGNAMPLFYYGPRRLAGFFEPAFSFKKTLPIGICIPPSYLESAFLNRKNQLQRLNTWEARLSVSGFLSNLADHYCLILKKNPVT